MPDFRWKLSKVTKMAEAVVRLWLKMMAEFLNKKITFQLLSLAKVKVINENCDC